MQQFFVTFQIYINRLRCANLSTLLVKHATFEEFALTSLFTLTEVSTAIHHQAQFCLSMPLVSKQEKYCIHIQLNVQEIYLF